MSGNIKWGGLGERKKIWPALWVINRDHKGTREGSFFEKLEQHWKYIIIGWGAKKTSRRPEDRRAQERRCKRICGIQGLDRRKKKYGIA